MNESTEPRLNADVLAQAPGEASSRRWLALHAIAYVIANGINASVDATDGGNWRVHWTVLGWDLCLACHAALVLVRSSLRDRWTERQTTRIAERLTAAQHTGQTR